MQVIRLCLLIALLPGCSWLQREEMAEAQLTSEGVVTMPDGTVLECRVGGRKSESATHDERKAKPVN